ncbi:MAG: hypothetical protein U1E94_00080 [Agitococcus sp.]
MKKIALVLLMAAVNFVPTPVLAFGLPKIPGIPILGGGGAAVDVQGFIDKASATNKLFQESALTLAMAIGDKTKVAELEALKKALDDTTDPKEKDAIVKKISEASNAALTAASEEKEAAAARLAEAKGEQLEKYLGAAKNFALGALQATELVPAGQSALASLQSNPLQATKLLGLKRTISDITGIVSNSTLALTKVPSIFAAANIPLTLPSSGKGVVTEAQ